MIMAGLPTWDIVNMVQNIVSMVMDAAQLGLSFWLFQGGILYIIRYICFFIDMLLINFIGMFYSYFSIFLSGMVFNKAVVGAIMRNVYIFIGVVVFFRLMMVLLKYIVNPELVSDGKIGASNLVKRVIIGIAGITLIPTIFNFANDFQAAFLQDQVIQKVLIPEELIEVSKKKVDNAGRYIGTYVFAGFFNPSNKASPNTIKKYDIALEKADMMSLAFDVNSGGFLANWWFPYEYDYFVFLSSFVLGYVLFLMIKYCLDLVGRLFKLFLYQMIAPFAMIEYMINGSQDGVFKSWKTAVLSTYFMLFVRVFALWFVVFVMTLMSGDLPTDVYTTGSLLNSSDYLLRAIIIVALLGFMMDLPKIVGNIFGLDLEQEGSATGLLNSIKGGFAKIAGAGLTMGGAMVGGAIGAAKGGLGSLNALGAKKGADQFGTLQSKWNNTRIGQTKLGQRFGKSVLGGGQDKMNARADKLGTLGTTGKDAFKGARSAVYKAGMGTNQYTSAVYSGYTAVNDTVKNKADKRKAEEMQEIQENRERERDRRDIARDRRRNVETIYESPEGKNMTKDELIERSTENEINSKISSIDMSAATANLDALIAGGAKVKVAAELVSQQVGNALSVPPQEVERIVKDVYDNSSIPAPRRAERIVDEVKGRAVEMTKQAVEVEVNQVYGNRRMDTIDDAVQTVHRDFVSTNDNINDTRQVVHQDIENNIRTVESVNKNIKENFTRTNETINTFQNEVHNDMVETKTVINDSVDKLNQTLRRDNNLGRGNQLDTNSTDD